jgi:hypothetical protein
MESPAVLEHHPEDSGEGGHEADTPPDHNPSSTLPTAPSPTTKQTDPFEVVDDVPSIHSESDHLDDQVSHTDIPRIPTDIPITMTRPLTPPSRNAEDHLTKLDEGSPRLLFAKLGGYGWRG